MDGALVQEQAVDSWGTAPVNATVAEAFAKRIAVPESDQRAIATTLVGFQPDGMVRGMFFSALKQVLAHAAGEQRAVKLAQGLGIKDRLFPFTLYPHRDFYRLWFSALPVIHPNRSVSFGMEKVSEIYFPVWLESGAGKTMALLLGRDPITICKRLRDAYAISVPHNEHSVEVVRDGVVRWTAKVEPSPYYPETFGGILRGAMRSQGVKEPRVGHVLRGKAGSHHQRIEFELDFT